jgi:hypothetical protein
MEMRCRQLYTREIGTLAGGNWCNSPVSVASRPLAPYGSVGATSPGGGWAAGLTVSYTCGGASYSTTAITGIALASSRVPEAARCKAEEATIKSNFKHRGVPPHIILTGYYIRPRQ